MRIRASREELRKAIAKTSRLWPAESRRNIPGVFITPRNGSVVLSCTDGHLTIQTKIDASIENARAGMLPMQLARVLSASKSDEINLDFQSEKIRISGGSARFGLKEPKAGKTSSPGHLQINPNATEISSKIFRRAIRATSFCTQTAPFTQNLGLRFVCIDLSESCISFKATDGTKIASYSLDLTTANHNSGLQQLLISPTVLRHLSKLASGATVKISCEGSDCAQFDFGENTRASVLLANGKFPNMDGVFAKFKGEDYQTVKLSKRELSGVFDQAAVVTTAEQQAVRIVINRQHLITEIQTPEVGEFCCEMGVLSEIEEAEVYLDLEMLRQGLSAIWHQGNVELTVATREKPIMLSAENYQFVMMQLALGFRQHHSYRGGLGATRRYIEEIPDLSENT